MRGGRPMAAVGGDQGHPFGGAPPVAIPQEAFAMGAYLKAEVATQNGDRAEALRQYADAVKYDPHNAALRVQLATLYVRDGHLKEALDQAEQAIALDPAYARPQLLAAGIDTATGDDATAEKRYQEVIKLEPDNQEAYLFLGKIGRASWRERVYI